MHIAARAIGSGEESPISNSVWEELVSRILAEAVAVPKPTVAPAEENAKRRGRGSGRSGICGARRVDVS
eukprot:9470950-Pyramimonas_sp.AAC.1